MSVFDSVSRRVGCFMDVMLLVGPGERTQRSINWVAARLRKTQPKIFTSKFPRVKPVKDSVT